MNQQNTSLFLTLLLAFQSMQNLKEVYLLTGSNIEPRIHFLQEAMKEINSRIGKIYRSSSIYESEAWGFESDISFLNQVLVIRSKLSVNEILDEILRIEHELGRKRIKGKYTSRSIDIDILYFGSEIIKTNELTVPHARLHERIFTLMPLEEIAEDFIHPVLKMTNKELLEKSQDKNKVWIYKPENGV